MNAITPGPWFVLPDPVWRDLHPMHQARYVATSATVKVTGKGEGGSWRFADDRDVIICTMPDSPDQQINACAIAALPELIKALQLFVEQYQGNDHDERELRPEMIAARAAFKKAGL